MDWPIVYSISIIHSLPRLTYLRTDNYLLLLLIPRDLPPRDKAAAKEATLRRLLVRHTSLQRMSASVPTTPTAAKSRGIKAWHVGDVVGPAGDAGGAGDGDGMARLGSSSLEGLGGGKARWAGIGGGREDGEDG